MSDKVGFTLYLAGRHGNPANTLYLNQLWAYGLNTLLAGYSSANVLERSGKCGTCPAENYTE
jgi:hypothetical protein